MGQHEVKHGNGLFIIGLFSGIDAVEHLISGLYAHPHLMLTLDFCIDLIIERSGLKCFNRGNG